MACTITIQNENRSRVTGSYQAQPLDEAFSFSPPGARFVKSRYGWDGKTHLFDSFRGTFPTGLLPLVLIELKRQDILEPVIIDQRKRSIMPYKLADTLGGNITLREDQKVAVRAALSERRGVIHGVTGCVSGDARVGINRNGKSFKISLAGLEERFGSWPGETRLRYRHSSGCIRLGVLDSVWCSGVKDTYELCTVEGHRIRATLDHQFLTKRGWLELRDISVYDLVYVEDTDRKRCVTKRKLNYKMVCGLPYHPFCGPKLARSGYRVPYHRLVVEASNNNLTLNDFIHRIKSNSISGLTFLDPKKIVVHHKDRNVKNNNLANLEAISESDHRRLHGLNGFWANAAFKTKAVGIASIEKHSTEKVFDLKMRDEPHNFLANGIVVHNCGKTEIAASIIASLGIPKTLFITGRKKLATQTQARLSTRLGVPVGLLAGGSKPAGESVVVAVVNSLATKNKPNEVARDLVAESDVIIFDEAHHMGSTTWYAMCQRSKAQYRIGLTGSPVGRSDNKDMKLIAATGPIIATIKMADLVEDGTLAKPSVVFMLVDQPSALPVGWANEYKRGIEKNKFRNERIVSLAYKAQERGMRVLILARKLAHGRHLARSLKCQFIYSGTNDEATTEAIRALDAGDIHCLVASSVLDEGIDIPGVDCVILAGAYKSKINQLQRTGRGLRKKVGRANKALILDFMDLCGTHLKHHSMQRWQCFIEMGIEPHLVRKIESVFSIFDKD